MGQSEPTVALTMGDPAGVGAEVIVKAVPHLVEDLTPLVVGDAGVVERAIDVTDGDQEVQRVEDPADVERDESVVPVYDLDNVPDHEFGVVREEYGRASGEYNQRAIEFEREGLVDAVTSAPTNTKSRNLANVGRFSEILADYEPVERKWFLLIKDSLRIAHVTTHIPFKEILETVRPDEVEATVRETERWFRYLGIEDPHIAVAGINPHAGYGGLTGSEEEDLIEPAIERVQDDGLDVVGPESPDIVFGETARGAFDGVVAMYHDQGHIPFKTYGATSGKQFTGTATLIGLPVVWTTPTHGTAFEVAGTGAATGEGMVNATRIAGTVASNRPDEER